MRRPLVIISLVLALGAAAYSGWWYLLAARTDAGFQAWVEARRAEGMEITYDGHHVEGYPLLVMLVIDNPFIRNPEPGGTTSWTTEHVRAWAKPWAPHRILVEPTLTHRVVVQRPDRRIEAELHADALLGRVTVGTGGLVDAVDVSIEGGVAMVDGEDNGRLSRLVVRLDNLSALSNQQPKTIRMEATNLILPQLRGSPLGSRFEAVALDADISGIVAGDNVRHAMAGWRDSGGKAVINSFRAGWGQLAVAASGEIDVDAALQPRMKLDARTTGLPETVDILAQRGYIQSGAAKAMKFALSVLGSRSASGPRGSIDVPLAIRDQTFFLGPIGLGKLPEIAWR
jgi:hypothetical protein